MLDLFVIVCLVFLFVMMFLCIFLVTVVNVVLYLVNVVKCIVGLILVLDFFCLSDFVFYNRNEGVCVFFFTIYMYSHVKILG